MLKKAICAVLIVLSLAARRMAPQAGAVCCMWLFGTGDERVQQAALCFSETLTRERSVLRAAEDFYEAVEAFGAD